VYSAPGLARARILAAVIPGHWRRTYPTGIPVPALVDDWIQYAVLAVKLMLYKGKNCTKKKISVWRSCEYY